MLESRGLRRSFGVTLLGISSAAMACTPPVAVGRYAQSADRTADAFAGVARDMSASCRRFERYKAQAAGGGWDDDAALRQRCAVRDSAVRGAIAASQVLRAYFGSLARLSADEPVEYDSEVAALGRTVGDLVGAERPQAKAVSGLAAFLADAAARNYRRSQLSAAIESQHDNVLTVVDGLKAIVSDDYALQLEVERRAATDYYHTLVAEHGAREPLGAVLVQSLRDERVAAIDAKHAALGEYARALGRLRSGFESLYAGRHHLDAAALTEELNWYATTMDDVVTALTTAF